MTAVTKIRTGLLRYRADRITVVLVPLAVLVQFALYLAFQPLWWEVIVMLGLMITLLRPVDLIEHNVAHVPLFHHQYQKLEEFYELMMAVGTAMPMELYRVQHVQTHHHFTKFGADLTHDWSGPFSYSGTRPPWHPSHWRYAIMFYPRAWSRGIKIMMGKHRKTAAHGRFVRSMTLLVLSWSWLAIFNWRAWLLFYVTPWMIANVAKVRANWNHHVGCEYVSPETTANNNQSWFAMELGFYVGIHAAHHAEPARHWSLLPQLWWEEYCEKTSDRYIHHKRVKWLDRTPWLVRTGRLARASSK